MPLEAAGENGLQSRQEFSAVGRRKNTPTGRTIKTIALPGSRKNDIGMLSVPVYLLSASFLFRKACTLSIWYSTLSRR